MRQIARTLQTTAVVSLGLMAGFFFAFSVDVVPAMRALDAASYITAQQLINSTVRNALFGGVYFGSLGALVAAAITTWMVGTRRIGWSWILVAVVYAILVFWLTRSVNVPINDALATWSPAAPPAEWAALRDRWNAANLIRTIAASVCFVSATVLLAFDRPQRICGVGAT